MTGWIVWPAVLAGVASAVVQARYLVRDQQEEVLRARREERLMTQMETLVAGTSRPRRFGDLPIIESRHVPPGALITSRDAIYVRDAWDDLRLPLAIAAMRRDMRAHLDRVVRAAMTRLGLEVAGG